MRMRRTLGLSLLAATALASLLDAQDCPRRAVQHIRPSLREPVELAGTYQAPFEFVCGQPLTVRVQQSGTELTAVTQAPAGCAAAGRVRWSGDLAAGPASFPVRVAQAGGTLSARGTATLTDPCTLAITTAGRAGAARYRRMDGACAESGAPRPVVAFIGGALDDWNRNLQRVFCAYDAQWEGTTKLYFLHTDDPEAVRRRIVERAAGAPVALVGHSYGANFAYELANTMRDDGGVALLLTLDPVSGPAAPRVPLESGAARRWIHVWAGSGVGLSSCGLAGAIGGAWGSRPEADLDLRFPPDPARDSPSLDHCKTEEMFLLQPVQEALAELR
jgi:pimeloyl-ACP methyl ester carboxylesterase